MVKRRQKDKQPTVEKKEITVRPPVVTVLGHIDHGKTTLLDLIRKENVAQKEAGGITQHIGAYQTSVKIENKEKFITFIDTPGHEAFAKMRSRGAQVADIALLVISAKDGVMPQTKESIRYIKDAKIPLIVAINKIDLFKSKAEKEAIVKKIAGQLKKINVLTEVEGGKVICLPISAKTGENVKDLLEMIVLVAEIGELKLKKEAPLKGVVIESQVDRRRGILASILVREGILKIKDLIGVEGIQGKVKALFNEDGKRVKMAGPSQPVQVLGFNQAPPIGGIVKSEKTRPPARFATKRADRVKKLKKQPVLKDTKEKLKIVLKTDTLGTQEAVMAALEDKVEIITAGVGDISESDIFLAKTSKAPILGFNISVLPEIKRLAQSEGVKIRIYDVIYRLLDEVEDVVKFLKEEKKEKVLGRTRIVATFKIKKKKIAGMKVLEGRVARGDKIKILRDDQEIGQGRITTLRHQKEEIPKVEMGEECGAFFSKELDFEVGDVVKSIG